MEAVMGLALDCYCPEIQNSLVTNLGLILPRAIRV